MTPAEMRAAHPLISTSPNYRRILSARRRESIISKLLSPATAIAVFAAEYARTFDEVINPAGGDFMIGPGK